MTRTLNVVVSASLGVLFDGQRDSITAQIRTLELSFKCAAVQVGTNDARMACILSCLVLSCFFGDQVPALTSWLFSPRNRNAPSNGAVLRRRSSRAVIVLHKGGKEMVRLSGLFYCLACLAIGTGEVSGGSRFRFEWGAKRIATRREGGG